MSKEKQIEEMANDLDRILHKYVDISPRQYVSKEFSEKYRDMGIDIDLIGIITELYNAGYRKQIEGKWIKQYDGTHYCSNCGHDATYNYCSHEICGVTCTFCGARMKGADDEQRKAD